MRKFLLYSSALFAGGLLSGVANAACIQTPTCSSLGYTSTSSCTGGVKCPFGNAWNCTVNEIKTELTNKITELEKIIETSQQEEVQSKLKVGDILYSDMTCSSSNLSGKIPIGVIFDTTNSLAVGLEGKTGKWSSDAFDVPNLQNISDKAAAQLDWNGQNNTKLIWNYCKANGKSCPAIEYVSNYKTEGTKAGDWFLPSIGLWNIFNQNSETIQTSLGKIGKNPFIDTTAIREYWSSTLYSKTAAWYEYYANSFGFDGKSTIHGIIPVINFGKCTYVEPQQKCNVGDIFYSDKTCSADVIITKTAIGVVFDPTNRLVVGLEEDDIVWSAAGFDISGLNNITSIVVARMDWQGKNNTKVALEYCKANGESCPAFKYVSSYKTEGTQAGDWYLPAMGELEAIHENVKVLNTALAKLGGCPLSTNNEYWTSTEHSSGYAWECTGNASCNKYVKYDNYYLVRPVLAY